MDQVKGENHDQVADGDHFKVAVGTVAGPHRVPHADEGNQQRDLGREHRDIREMPTQDRHPGNEQHHNRNTDNHRGPRSCHNPGLPHHKLAGTV